MHAKRTIYGISAGRILMAGLQGGATGVSAILGTGNDTIRASDLLQPMQEIAENTPTTPNTLEVPSEEAAGTLSRVLGMWRRHSSSGSSASSSSSSPSSSPPDSSGSSRSSSPGSLRRMSPAGKSVWEVVLGFNALQQSKEARYGNNRVTPVLQLTDKELSTILALLLEFIQAHYLREKPEASPQNLYEELYTSIGNSAETADKLGYSRCADLLRNTYLAPAIVQEWKSAILSEATAASKRPTPSPDDTSLYSAERDMPVDMRTGAEAQNQRLAESTLDSLGFYV